MPWLREHGVREKRQRNDEGVRKVVEEGREGYEREMEMENGMEGKIKNNADRQTHRQRGRKTDMQN